MKRFLTVLTACALAAFGSPSASARPVSYPGGWALMSMNDGGTNRLHLLYTLTPRLAIGYNGEYWRDDDHQIHAVQVNNLLKRWNNFDSQGNLYLKSGVGAAYGKSNGYEDKWRPALYTGLAADWEDRRYFMSYENRVIEAGDIQNDFRQSVQVGITPYIGEYGDLHTWLMLKTEHTPEARDHFTITPMVRLFKGDGLVEAGVSNHGDIMFNLTYRY